MGIHEALPIHVTIHDTCPMTTIHGTMHETKPMPMTTVRGTMHETKPLPLRRHHVTRRHHGAVALW